MGWLVVAWLAGWLVGWVVVFDNRIVIDGTGSDTKVIEYFESPGYVLVRQTVGLVHNFTRATKEVPACVSLLFFRAVLSSSVVRFLLRLFCSASAGPVFCGVFVGSLL